MNLYTLVLTETVKRLKRSIIKFMLAVMFVPVLLSFIGFIIRISGGIDIRSWDTLPILFPLFFLTAVLISVGAVKEDVDDNSYVYVNILPFSKSLYYTARFLSSYILVYLFFLVSLTMFYIFSFLLTEGLFAEIETLFRYIFGFAFGFLAYCSVFNFFGTAFRKAAIYSIIYLFSWEFIFGYAFFFLEKLTIIFYLRNILPSVRTTGIKSIFLMRQDVVSNMHAVIALIIFSAVFFLCGLYIFHRKGYITGE